MSATTTRLSAVTDLETTRTVRAAAEFTAAVEGGTASVEGMSWALNKLATQRAKHAALVDADDELLHMTEERGIDAEAALLRVTLNLAARLAELGSTADLSGVRREDFQGRLAALETLTRLVRADKVLSRVTVAPKV